MRLTLETDDDLRRALTLASWLHRPAVSAVDVRLPWLDPAERDRSARAIRTLFNDRGCVAAAVALVVTAAVIAGAGADADWSWWGTGTATLVCLAVAAAGRLLALAAGRRRLRNLLRRMAPAAEASPPAGGTGLTEPAGAAGTRGD
jgi:hypothetical protein